MRSPEPMREPTPYFRASPGPENDSSATLRRHAERRRQLRGLILLALVAAVFLVVRFGAARVFSAGWWRLW